MSLHHLAQISTLRCLYGTWTETTATLNPTKWLDFLQERGLATNMADNNSSDLEELFKDHDEILTKKPYKHKSTGEIKYLTLLELIMVTKWPSDWEAIKETLAIKALYGDAGE
jgi:hypothetical protein